MDSDGDGSSSSSDVSSTADDEEPRADPELTPPTDLYFTEEEDALYRLYVRTRRRMRRRRRRRRRRRTRVQLDPNMEADVDADTADPASGVAIACMPKTTVGEGEARESGECAVCLEEYEAGDALRTMPCAHGFHELCIVKWLRASRLCPLCRFKLPPEEGTDEDTETDEEDDERDAGHDDDDGDDALEHLMI